MVRGETFGRNFIDVEREYKGTHEKEVGKDIKMSKFGYPDMGNNRYSDVLSYKDWIKINNAQRCHEHMVAMNPIFFGGAFVSALSFPQFTFF